jgi:hypothetical protein
VETLKGPGAKAAEITGRATRRKCEFTKDGNSRITNTSTSFEYKGNKAMTLRVTTQLPFSVLDLRSLLHSKTFLRRRLEMGSGITRAKFTHDETDDDIRAKVVEHLVVIDFHLGTANQRSMPKSGAVFGDGVAGHSMVAPVVHIGFVARWAAARFLFLLVGDKSLC